MRRSSRDKNASAKAAAKSQLKRELATQAAILFGFLALIWAIELFDVVLFRGGLDVYGIRPRTLSGLRGILLAPLLHGGFGHLVANTGPLLILGWMVMLRETHHWFVVGAIGTVVGGVGIWLVGAASSVHIGSSIVAFAFLGYLLLRGLLDKRLLPLLGSIAVGLAYGGLLFGVLPGQQGVSWEGHLFGLVGGALAAWLLAARARQQES